MSQVISYINKGPGQYSFTGQFEKEAKVTEQAGRTVTGQAFDIYSK